MANLNQNILGINFKNPLILASGTCGYGRELAALYDLSILGGIAVKGTTLEPRLGNIPSRIAETPAGMLNAVGLQNPGIKQVIATELPFVTAYDTAVILNIAGHDQEHYRAVAHELAQSEIAAKVAAVELNISCPNVKAGGMAFGTNPSIAAAITAIVRQELDLPLIVKLSPNVTDITAIAQAVEQAGADAISMINTVLGMAIDIEKKKPVLGNIVGGLSGPAIKPIALRMVWQTAQKVKIPIIGMGGIQSAADIIEFMMAGASLVQVGAGHFNNPFLPQQILADLDDWLNEHQIEDISSLIGALEI